MADDTNYIHGEDSWWWHIGQMVIALIVSAVIVTVVFLRNDWRF